MLLDVENITCDKCPPAIEKAIHAVDGEADVTVDTAESRVRIEGGITQQQAIDALSAAASRVHRLAARLRSSRRSNRCRRRCAARPRWPRSLRRSMRRWLAVA